MTLWVEFVLRASWWASCAFGVAGRLYKTLAADMMLYMNVFRTTASAGGDRRCIVSILILNCGCKVKK